MKAGYKLFGFLAIFYAVVDVVYWQVGGEALGITAIGLSGGLALTIGFYFYTNDKRMGLLPSDNLEGEIADLAGELGFFAPHSWWPLPLALSACAMGLGLIVGWWLTIIALGSLVVSIIGFTTEYEKPGVNSGH